RTHHRAKTHADNHIGNEYTWWNYESLGEGKYLWKGTKGTVLLRTNTGVYDLSATTGPPEAKSAGQHLPERTLADVTTRDENLETRVEAAAGTVHKISVTFPEHTDESDNGGNGEDGP